jgi:hypothetical protein
MELKFKKELETEVFISESCEIAILQKHQYDEEICVLLSADKAQKLAEFLLGSGIIERARELAECDLGEV